MKFLFVTLVLSFDFQFSPTYGKSIVQPVPTTQTLSLDGMPQITIRGSHMSTSSHWPPNGYSYGSRTQPLRTSLPSNSVPTVARRTFLPTSGYFGYPGYGGYYGQPNYGGYYGSAQYPYYGNTYGNSYGYPTYTQGYPQYNYPGYSPSYVSSYPSYVPAYAPAYGYNPGSGYYVQQEGIYPQGNGHYHGGIYGYDSHPPVPPVQVNQQLTPPVETRPQEATQESPATTPDKSPTGQEQTQLTQNVASPTSGETFDSPTISVEKSELTKDRLKNDSENEDSGESSSSEDEENIKNFVLDQRKGESQD